MTDLSKDEVLKALAAAEFAAAFAIPLDLLVTMDFDRLGVASPADARNELQRFIKSANAWSYDRSLPTASIAVLERSPKGKLHGHIAIHVPGMGEKDGQPTGVRHRSHFRQWAGRYTDRHFGGHIARAINVRGSLRPSILRHWISVSYLLKGYDQHAVLVAARNRPDGWPLRLGDILAFDHVKSEIPELRSRLLISANLGHSRRMRGVPPVAEHLLKPVADLFALSVTTQGCPSLRPNKSALKRVSEPFHAAVLDGVYDVRQIYGEEFAAFVTGLKLIPPVATK